MLSALPAGRQNRGRRGNEQFQLNPGMSDLSEIAAAHSVLTASLHVIAEKIIGLTITHTLPLSLPDTLKDRETVPLSATCRGL